MAESHRFRGFIVSNNTTSEPGFAAGQGFYHGLCPARFGIGCPADAYHWADPSQGVNGSGNATIYLLAEEDPDGDNVFTPVPWTRLKLINGQTDGGTPNLGVHPPDDEAPRVIQQRSAQPDIGFEAPFDFVNLEFVE